MTLAIADTDVTPLTIQKVRSGEPIDFQKLYQKFYDFLLQEARFLIQEEDQAITLVQLSCIQNWVQCEAITSEAYYFGYGRSRILRYAQVWSHREPQIQHELKILQELLSDRYALSEQHMASLYGHLALSQKALVLQVFKSYFRPGPAHPPVEKHPLLDYAFYSLHYILG
ncbi:hypothetical protein [Niastella populi]|uniref:Uncharacterized protein n=1 Tax=Niastella populi TaxID=550983 RepID=A0A1V9G823_9BACT|nr:hypothetical protein [Niastella populi]OQP66628.1 hypothetical protein A4R26_12645 [Niastella populi]